MFSAHPCIGPLPFVAVPAVADAAAVAVGVTALAMLLGPMVVLELAAVLTVAGCLEVLGIWVRVSINMALNFHGNRKVY